MSRNRGSISVATVMTHGVRSVGPEERLDRACEILTDGHCHHLPIVERGRPVGMVSSRDLIRVAQERGASTFSAQLLGGATVAEIMTPAVETVHLDDSVDSAIDRIGKGDIHSLAVIDDEGALAGIVTHNDLLQYLMS